MAVLPLRNRKKAERAQVDLARLPVIAAAFLIALFGLLAGTPRNTDLSASTRPIDDRSDRGPSLTKREPVRAITVAERKDATAAQVTSHDGLPAPTAFTLPENAYAAAQGINRAVSLHLRLDWPGALPRAPPIAA
ncbi:hypothetical protein [Neorhizobium sp. NCHU2750]|uniref:hypothetical protein n=1 Tax=Neorhizobium sp. NCHU2750 TaxID=1825976 RepID=UPI000E76AC3D|nr:hypothetical protein NCHU2750_18100 [Neorhizobium sp. NCHU2750]